MRQFFYPSAIAVFGVGEHPGNLARNIIFNCRNFGFMGRIYAVGKHPGTIDGHDIITTPESLPSGIELAVILVPADQVAGIMDLCGQKGIGHAVVSTGGYRELDAQGNRVEKDLLESARRHNIRFIGPNCIGVICANSGLCTSFNPMTPINFKKGRISLIAQSGGIATQAAHYFSEEHVGFSKIISAGNKMNIDEKDLMEYLLIDKDTDQIHLYLESIDDGRALLRLARRAKKPIVLFKSNVSRAAGVAMSHTAVLSNDDRIVDAAMKQAGIIRVKDIHGMTVCAKALRTRSTMGVRTFRKRTAGVF